MSRHWTKLSLAVVVALALLALGTTSILAPAWAAKPATLPIDCTVGEVAKWSPLPGGGESDFYWACAADIDTDTTIPDTDTNAETICSGDQVLHGDGSCGAVSSEEVVTDIQAQLDNLALLAFGQASAFVFLTSTPYTGNLGGTDGANDKCNAHAAAAGLPGEYKAWVSATTGDDPESSFDRAIGRYITPLGSRIAHNWSQLTDGDIDNPFNVDEFGNDIGWKRVWTNTSAVGSVSDTVVNCNGFTSALSADRARTGSSGETGYIWTAQFYRSCDNEFHLYCVGQGFGTAFE